MTGGALTEDPVWADVTPVPQDEGPAPICAIAYAPECVGCAAAAGAFADGTVRSAGMPRPPRIFER